MHVAVCTGCQSNTACHYARDARMVVHMIMPKLLMKHLWLDPYTCFSWLPQACKLDACSSFQCDMSVPDCVCKWLLHSLSMPAMYQDTEQGACAP